MTQHTYTAAKIENLHSMMADLNDQNEMDYAYGQREDGTWELNVTADTEYQLEELDELVEYNTYGNGIKIEK